MEKDSRMVIIMDFIIISREDLVEGMSVAETLGQSVCNSGALDFKHSGNCMLDFKALAFANSQ